MVTLVVRIVIQVVTYTGRILEMCLFRLGGVETESRVDAVGRDCLQMITLRSYFRQIPRISVQYRSMKIVPVLVSSDNYAYLLIDESTKKAAAIDPYDVSKVSAAADAQGVEIIAGITTHHHFDHSGGNQVCYP